jgi:hypothetical protein
MDIVKRLPFDIKEKIYEDHFSISAKYKALKKILDCEESQNLNYKPIAEYLSKNEVLSDTVFINYLMKTDDIFNTIYTNHYVKNNKNFINFTTFDSFCLSWLMYLYH